MPQDCVEKSLLSFARAAPLLREGKAKAASDMAMPVIAAAPSIPLRQIAATLLIRSSMVMGDRQKTIQLIASEGARNPPSTALLPVREALEHLEYADYKALGPSLTPLIALDLLWRATDNDTTASTLRFATGQFLRQLKIPKPSALIDRGDEFQREELIYFLRRICCIHQRPGYAAFVRALWKAATRNPITRSGVFMLSHHRPVQVSIS